MDLARWRYAPGQGWELHAHEFHELFWVEHGTISHRRDDVVEELGVGQLRLIRPEQRHHAHATGRGAMIVNLSVTNADVAALRMRYGIDLWAGAGQHRLSAAEVASLGRLVSDLDPRRDGDRDLLLLQIAHRIRLPTERDLSPLPANIQAGLRSYGADGAWGEGTVGLARRAGVSREHLSRSIRRALGCTAAELLLDLRLAACARALLREDGPVAGIANAYGFAGLGHFHRRFLATFGEHPAAYRKRLRAGGPSGADPRTPPKRGIM